MITITKKYLSSTKGKYRSASLYLKEKKVIKRKLKHFLKANNIKLF